MVVVAGTIAIATTTPFHYLLFTFMLPFLCEAMYLFLTFYLPLLYLLLLPLIYLFYTFSLPLFYLLFKLTSAFVSIDRTF